MVPPQPARIIDERETFHKRSVRTESRLHDRYAALLSRFLIARSYSAELRPAGAGIADPAPGLPGYE
jgi:hypothetical protein